MISVDLLIECPSSVSAELIRAWTAARDPYVRDNWMLDVAVHPLPPRTQVAHRVDFGDTIQEMFFVRHGRQGSSNTMPSASISFARANGADV